ncbi:MAG: cryptochrome/photolyase family protein [Thermoleophilia bacterium]
MTTDLDLQGSGRPVLLWLRRALRLRDNPALELALELAGGDHPAGGRVDGRGRGAGLIPVYVMDEGSGPWSTGAASRRWLAHSLTALDADLRRRGSRLVLRAGPARDELPALAAETGARHVVADRRWEPAWVQSDRELAEVLGRTGAQMHAVAANLLFDPESVRTRDGRPFTTFTHYWRACLELSEPVTGSDPPTYLPAPPRWPRSLEAPTPAPTGLETWAPGEEGAIRSLAAFLQNALAEYASGRDRPDLPGTSRLSPHLSFGEISPARVWAEVRARPATQSTETFLKELGWREFAYHLLHHFPHTPEEPLRERFASFPWEDDPEGLKAWRQGVTGFPIVDAGMRQLGATGWMHNRVRMVVASFLVKDLLVPWQEGAAWFWRELVDADLAGNTLGWQWAAGSGADAAPYFRVFNPVLQGERFDPSGSYVARWIPELSGMPARWIHRPWEAPAHVREKAGVHLGDDYPRPIVEHAVARQAALAAFRSLRKY